eukprot:c25987_g1_i6 orf=83-508(-)
MGRPPIRGGPVFRFFPKEVTAMEKVLEDIKGTCPSREVAQSLADMFSSSLERAGTVSVQCKQVWKWFQNKRYVMRKGAKAADNQGVLMTSDAPIAERAMAISAAVPSGGKKIEPVKMEFEAKSSRDGAWASISKCSSKRMD